MDYGLLMEIGISTKGRYRTRYSPRGPLIARTPIRNWLPFTLTTYVSGEGNKNPLLPVPSS